MSIDIAKKQLMKLDAFIEGLQTELVTLAQYTDVGPSRALYAHVRELIKDLINENDPKAFAEKFQGMNEAVAGILIVIVPSVARSVEKNMQKAHGKDFDNSAFEQLVKEMTQNTKQRSPRDPNAPEDADDDNPIEDEVENKVEDVISMLGLEKHVKPTAKPGSKDTLGGVYDKY